MGEEQHFESGTPKRQRRSGASCSEANSLSLNASQDIEAVIGRKREDLERSELELQNEISKMRKLMPIVCGGQSYPDPVKDAALIALRNMLDSRPNLAPLAFEHHPDLMKHLDELTVALAPSKDVLISTLQLVNVLISQCMMLVISGGNDTH